MFIPKAVTLFTNLIRIESWVSFRQEEGHTKIQISAEPGIEPVTLRLEGRDLTNCATTPLLILISSFYNHAHCVHISLFWRATGFLNTTVSGLKMLFISHFSRPFYHRAQCLFPIDVSGPHDSVIFVRPVARQDGGTYTLRMIVKVANSILIQITRYILTVMFSEFFTFYWIF